MNTRTSTMPADRATAVTLVAVLILGAVPFTGHTPLPAQTGSPSDIFSGDTSTVSATLDAFHEAASRADGEAYFALFAEGGVFLGTDAGEHWTVEEFENYARPFFDRGQGWTYVPTERHVYLAPSEQVAWFDELLENEGLGLTRGTGVLVVEDGEWRVAQYHLTIPVPNEIAGDVVERIRALQAGGQ